VAFVMNDGLACDRLHACDLRQIVQLHRIGTGARFVIDFLQGDRVAADLLNDTGNSRRIVAEIPAYTTMHVVRRELQPDARWMFNGCRSVVIQGKYPRGPRLVSLRTHAQTSDERRHRPQ
jgi:hypothetical protein